LGEAMSSFTEVVLITAAYSPGMYIYLLLDRMRKDRENEIVTGVVRGVGVSTLYRRISLYSYWATAAIIQMGYTLSWIIAFLVMAENVDDEGAKLVAYVFTFFSAIGLLGAMSLAVMGYVHCVSVLRQAEAD
jgi:predicted secreted protein